jgi:cytoplasmic iron level regulating protein YaaA (DUF328/UPF0246 family)
MLILLPPSEGKAAPSGGPPLALAELAFAAELTESRRNLLSALERLAAEPLPRALAMLGVSPGQAGEVEVDAKLAGAPAAPAAEVYTGVLYERLGLASLPARARKRVLIASALWGMVRPEDRIPYYRLSAKAKLPGVGALAGFWRPALREALAGEDVAGNLIVDMRSGAYSAAWKPREAELVAVRAFSDVAGKRKPVSHMAKAVRGEVAKALLKEKRAPKDAAAAASVAEAAGFEVELTPGHLDVIVRDA